MSKIIEFNAKDYRFDGTCQDNVGERVFITTDLGTKEVWEIGDWKWSRTQIFREMTLEKSTDYILRFAVSGGYCDTWDSISQVWIYHTDGYDTPEDAWEDKMSFPLDNDRFAPIISKKDRTGVIRVFEIPFNTGDFENWRITFVAQHAVARFMAAGENSAYEKLDDLTLEKLKNTGGQAAGSGSGSSGSGTRIDLSGASISEKKLRMILTHKPDDIDLSGADVYVDNEPEKQRAEDSEKNLSESQFAEMLNDIKDGSCVGFENITVCPNSSPDEKLVIGEPVDGAVLEFSNVTLTSLAMSAVMAKLRDGCIVTFSDINVTSDGIDRMISTRRKADGTVIELSDARLPRKVLELIKGKPGDGCHLSTDNITAYPV